MVLWKQGEENQEWQSEGTGKKRFCGYCGRPSRGNGGGGLPQARHQPASFYLWKKKYAGLGLSELRELRQLREENGKLKRLVADLTLDRHILQEIVAKKL